MKSFTVRLDDDVYEELGKLAKLRGVSLNRTLSDIIRVSYNEIEADPKVQKLLEQMNEIKTLLNKFEQDK